MPTSKIKKHEILKRLLERVKTQKSILLLSSTGKEENLDAEKNYKFRKEARTNGVIIEVVKNTLIARMFENLPDKLKGQTYLAYLEDGENSDEISVPKSVVGSVEGDFAKNFEIYGAIVNGEFLDTTQAIGLSKVASKNDSMAMVAGTINQIIAKIALTIKEIPASTARAVAEVSKQK